MPRKPIDGPLNDEDAHDGLRRHPQGAQDGDVRLLIRDRHDQDDGDADGGDQLDEREDNEHHGLLHGDGS